MTSAVSPAGASGFHAPGQGAGANHVNRRDLASCGRCSVLPPGAAQRSATSRLLRTKQTPASAGPASAPPVASLISGPNAVIWPGLCKPHLSLSAELRPSFPQQMPFAGVILVLRSDQAATCQNFCGLHPGDGLRAINAGSRFLNEVVRGRRGTRQTFPTLSISSSTRSCAAQALTARHFRRGVGASRSVTRHRTTTCAAGPLSTHNSITASRRISRTARQAACQCPSIQLVGARAVAKQFACERAHRGAIFRFQAR